MKLTRYSRSDGCICFEANLFGNEQFLQRIPMDLISTGLNWYWASARSRPLEANSEFANRPAESELTLITESLASEFINDFSERDVDGYGRSIVLFGTDPTTDVQSLETLEVALRAFSESEQGPIRLVIVQVGDSGEYIFVPHQPAESVTRLLDRWGIVPSHVDEVLPYERLNIVKLESLKNAILRLAYGKSVELRS